MKNVACCYCRCAHGGGAKVKNIFFSLLLYEGSGLIGGFFATFFSLWEAFFGLAPFLWTSRPGCMLNGRPRRVHITSGWRKAFQHSPGCQVVPMLQYIITNLFIILRLYSVYCVTHISTQLAYCANLMVMLSCITIMKLLNQTIAVETLYLIYATYAMSKTIASPHAQLFTVSMISNR